MPRWSWSSARFGRPLATMAWVVALGLMSGPGHASRGGEVAPSVFRDGFEGPRPAWRQEEADTAVRLQAHDRTDRARHEGLRSERFQFEAGPGSALYYSYRMPAKIPVAEDLEVNLSVRSDHSGLQLFARVILPGDIDPDTGQPSFVLVPGPSYEAADRWQHLRFVGVRAELERRVRVLRTRAQRPIPLDGAYLEQLVVNLYGGPGETVVYLDDLSLTPAPESAPPLGEAAAEAATHPGPEREGSRDPSAAPGPAPRAPAQGVRLDRNRLTKDGWEWVFTAIRAPGADTEALLRHGFDVLAVDVDHDPTAAREAARQGFLLMAELPSRTPAGSVLDPAGRAAAAMAYPVRDAVVFWNLGEHLGRSGNLADRRVERDQARETVARLRAAAAGGAISPLTTAEVDGMLADYARVPKNLDLIGIRPLGWGAAQEITETYQFLDQRRVLTSLRNPQGLFWAWIAAAPPPQVHRAVWGRDVPPAWAVARVQPEQLRLYTYAALAAGYRGVGYLADASLTQAAGRPLLLEMALLNAEIDLFQGLLAKGIHPPLLPTFLADPPVQIVYTSPGQGQGNNANAVKSIKAMAKDRPEVQPNSTIYAATIAVKDRRDKLLLVADFGAGAQWQPGQLAVEVLKIRVPGASENAQAYEVSLGGVALLASDRVPGGMEFTLESFGPTSLVLVTTDTVLVDRLKAAVGSVRSLAVAMAIEQARLKYQEVVQVHEHLLHVGEKVRNASDLLEQARKRIDSAQAALEREDYETAWAEARRVGRPLRLLMHSHWQRAYGMLLRAVAPPEDRNPPDPPRYVPTYSKNKPPKPPRKPPRIISPVACPPLLAFHTLPQHYDWVQWIKDGRFGPTLLPSGSFDDPDDLTAAGWENASYATEGVRGQISNPAGGRAKQSRRCLMLEVAPALSGSIDSLPAFLDHPAAAIRSPAVRVEAGQLARISVWVLMPRQMPPGAGGLIVRDSLGGEPLQFRTSGALPEWSEILLFRRAPADGILTVTIGLAGFGVAVVDDLKIELLEGSTPTGPLLDDREREKEEQEERDTSGPLARQERPPARPWPFLIGSRPRLPASSTR